jgi:hypothetical protein
MKTNGAITHQVDAVVRRQQLIGWIIEYIIDERFPIQHIEALKTIICTFNLNQSSEAEIFEFAEIIRKKYLSV